MRYAFVTLMLGGMLSHAASAQLNTFEFRVSNIISPDQPAAIVEVWASFDPALHEFGWAEFDVIGTADDGGFETPNVLLSHPESEDGEIQFGGDSVLGIASGQIYFPPNLLGDDSNPIPIWRAIWTTHFFSSRTIELATVTRDYSLYHENGLLEDFLNEFFAEGTWRIQVVPAPSGLALIALGAAIGVRRGRHCR
jgi:hypothetical protein